MKKIVAALAITLLFGCAAPGAHIDNMLKQGDLVSAYKYAIVRGEKQEQKADFISSLKSHPSGFSLDKFYRAISSDIMGGYKSLFSFVEYAKLIRLAFSDGLITELQYKALTSELLYVIEAEAVSSPDLLKSKILLSTFPEINSPQAKLDSFNHMLNVLSEKQSVKLSDLSPLITTSLIINNEELTNRLRHLGYKAAADELNSLSAKSATSKISYSDFLPLVLFSNFYGDVDFSNKLKLIAKNVNFSKKDLNSSEIIAFDPEFSKNELMTRVVKYRLSIEPDDGAFHEDLVNIISANNEWVEFDDASKNILLVKRQRFHENLGNPSNGTEIIPDPSFVTLLFIPKNASVLFDYINTDFRIDYSIDVSISTSNKRKNIRGSDTLRRTECRNIRFQNVFGGVGSIDWFPNDRVQSFCTSSNSATFDSLKKIVIEKIATDINSTILIK